MAIGDIGGTTKQLIITCVAKGHISDGDAVQLVGPYTVSSLMDPQLPVFGVAIQETPPHYTVPVCVRGVLRFKYENRPAPCIDGMIGIIPSNVIGRVNCSLVSASKVGIVLRVFEEIKEVEVLL